MSARIGVVTFPGSLDDADAGELASDGNSAITRIAIDENNLIRVVRVNRFQAFTQAAFLIANANNDR